jgi:hypothetical protein
VTTAITAPSRGQQRGVIIGYRPDGGAPGVIVGVALVIQPRSMPGWLQAFVRVNPISHVARRGRDLMNNAGGPVACSLIAAGMRWPLIARFDVVPATFSADDAAPPSTHQLYISLRDV